MSSVCAFEYFLCYFTRFLTSAIVRIFGPDFPSLPYFSLKNLLHVAPRGSPRATSNLTCIKQNSVSLPRQLLAFFCSISVLVQALHFSSGCPSRLSGSDHSSWSKDSQCQPASESPGGLVNSMAEPGVFQQGHR